MLRTETEYDSVFAAALGRASMTVAATGEGMSLLTATGASARICPADGGCGLMLLHAVNIRLAASAAGNGGITSSRKRIPDQMGRLNLG